VCLTADADDSIGPARQHVCPFGDVRGCGWSAASRGTQGLSPRARRIEFVAMRVGRALGSLMLR
jgi:hypothetical protein